MADMSLLTITCTAGEVQPVEFNSKYNTIDIFNNTDGDLLISKTGEFVNDGNVGYYVTIPSEVAYNNFYVHKTIYLKASNGGTITIAVRR